VVFEFSLCFLIFTMYWMSFLLRYVHYNHCLCAQYLVEELLLLFLILCTLVVVCCCITYVGILVGINTPFYVWEFVIIDISELLDTLWSVYFCETYVCDGTFYLFFIVELGRQQTMWCRVFIPHCHACPSLHLATCSKLIYFMSSWDVIHPTPS